MNQSIPWIQYALAVGGLFLSIFLVIMALVHRAQVSFWVMNTWYSLPFLGKIEQLAGQRVTRDRDGWLGQERELCADYSRFTDFISEGEFNRDRTYLSRARDLGRGPLHPGLLFVLLVLVAAEAYGFSYILAGTLAADMSEEARLYGTAAVMIVICLVMLWLTHAAGQAHYRNALVTRCEREADEWNQKYGNQQEPLHTGKIRLDEDQNKDGDDQRKWFTQCMNRINQHPNRAIVIVAVIAVVGLGVGQTWLRFTAANKAQTAATGMLNRDMGVPDFSTLPLPADLAEPQKQADARVEAEYREASFMESVAGFVLLGFIYLITQSLTLYAGFHSAFGGEESALAYRRTRAAGSYDEYMSIYNRMISTADARLLTLRQKIQRRGVSIPFQFEHTFDDWLAAVRRRGSLRGREAFPRVAAAEVETVEPVAAALRQLQALTGAAREAFLLTLDRETFEKVVGVLRDQQGPANNGVDEAEAARRKAALDGLL